MNSPYIIALEDRVIELTNDLHVAREQLKRDADGGLPASESDCLGTLAVNLYVLANEILALRKDIDYARAVKTQ